MEDNEEEVTAVSCGTSGFVSHCFASHHFVPRMPTRLPAEAFGVHAKTRLTVKTLLTIEQLREGVVRLAREIGLAYRHQSLTIVGVMTGSVVLLADLIRLLEMPLRVGVLQASSYRGGASRGELSINATMMLDIANRDVLLVDDIFDTGHTLARTVETLQKLAPTSLHTCVLLRKQGRQEVAMNPDFVGFEIPDEFVVGYGLDYRDQYRNLPYLAVLTPADLAEA